MDRTQRLSLLAAIMGTFVVGLDSTVVNVALPAIEEDLGGGLAGRAVDLERLPARAGVADPQSAGRWATCSANAACSSPGLWVRRRSSPRAAPKHPQAGACSRTSPARRTRRAAPPAPHRLPAERGAAIGSWTAWSGIATVVGPLVGGQLIDAFSWRWIFALNVPFIAITMPPRGDGGAAARASWRPPAGRLARRAYCRSWASPGRRLR